MFCNIQQLRWYYKAFSVKWTMYIDFGFWNFCRYDLFSFQQRKSKCSMQSSVVMVLAAGIVSCSAFVLVISSLLCTCFTLLLFVTVMEHKAWSSNSRAWIHWLWSVGRPRSSLYFITFCITVSFADMFRIVPTIWHENGFDIHYTVLRNVGPYYRLLVFIVVGYATEKSYKLYMLLVKVIL